MTNLNKEGQNKPDIMKMKTNEKMKNNKFKILKAVKTNENKEQI